MSVCSFDWDIIYKFFQTSLTVIMVAIVYYLWHRQKGKEVIANEAKEIFKLLEQASVQSHEYFQEVLLLAHQNQPPMNFDKDKLFAFRNLNLDISKRLDLIIYQNSDKKTKFWIDNFELSYVDYMHYYFSNNLMDLEKMESATSIYIQSAYDLRKDMYKYALDKKNI